MKINYVILSFLILAATQSFSQKTRAELIFKDGTILEGIAEPLNNNYIKYRKERKAKKEYFTFEEVDTLKMYYDFVPKIYVLVKIKDHPLPKILELARAGKNVVYYRDILQGNIAPMAFSSMGGGGSMISGGGFYNIKHSYVRKTDEEEAEHLASSNWISKNFKNSASNFFSDCPELVQKIENREFKKRDLKEIIEFYNTKCSIQNLN